MRFAKGLLKRDFVFGSSKGSLEGTKRSYFFFFSGVPGLVVPVFVNLLSGSGFRI